MKYIIKIGEMGEREKPFGTEYPQDFFRGELLLISKSLLGAFFLWEQLLRIESQRDR